MSAGKAKGGTVVLAQRRGQKDVMEEPMPSTLQLIPQEKVKWWSFENCS
jgi:hypothetical protein